MSPSRFDLAASGETWEEILGQLQAELEQSLEIGSTLRALEDLAL